MIPMMMRPASTCAALLLGVSLLASACGQAREDPPIDPASIYDRISPRAAQVFDGESRLDRLSAAEWRADLDTLAATLDRRLPYADAATGGADLDRRRDSLRRLVPRQTHTQRALSVFRLMNLPASGTGHTTIRAAQPALGWRALPLWTYRFADGTYVMSAATPDLIGREVLAIGGTPIDSVYAALAPYASADNRWHRQYQLEGHVSELLRFADPLRALGIVDDIDAIPVRVRRDDGTTERVRIETVPPDSRAWVRFLTAADTRPDVPTRLEWSPAATQQDLDEPDHRLSYRDSTDLLYLDFNTVADTPNRTVAELADRIRTLADERPLDTFVLDLRTNNGGNSTLIEPLVQVLGSHPAIDRRGALYVLIGSRSFSAAGLLAMELERKTKAIFAGQSSGFAPNIWGENSLIELPHSGLVGVASYAYYQAGMPEDPRAHLEPDLRVPFTAEQHFSNVDSTMIAVRRHEPAPRETTALTAQERRRFVGTYRLSPVHVARVTAQADDLHLQVTGETAALRLSEDGPAVFLDSDLYPLSERRLATDVHGAVLRRDPGEEGLRLRWKDSTYVLSPAPNDVKAPIEHVRDGNLDRGVRQLRRARASGMMLGNNLVEYPFTWRAEALLEAGKNQEALRYARAARTLCPRSPRVLFTALEVYQALGRTEKMRRTARQVVQLSPVEGREWLQYLDVSVPE
jgi:hypothetical protein